MVPKHEAKVAMGQVNPPAQIDEGVATEIVGLTFTVMVWNEVALPHAFVT